MMEMYGEDERAEDAARAVDAAPVPPAAGARGRVGLVIPAAGQGLRMGGGVPKQARLLGGVPVLARTLARLTAHPDVTVAVVAVPEADLDAYRAMLDGVARVGVEVQVVAGGASRQASVAAAVAALPEGIDIVLVHDAVRPFVPPSVIAAVVDAARAHGAAVPAVPVADTLRRASVDAGGGGVFGATVPRDGLFQVQTPQGFRADLLRAALAHAAATATPDATDDAALVAALGHRVRLVSGDRRAFKLTTPDDWALAEALLAAGA